MAAPPRAAFPEQLGGPEARAARAAAALPRSAANGAAPKSTAPRSRGGSRCRCRARRRPGAETASARPRGGSRRSVGRGNRADTSVAQQAILYRRFLLCAGAGGLGISTGYMELVATMMARLEDEDDPPAPTALGGRPASCKQLPHP